MPMKLAFALVGALLLLTPAARADDPPRTDVWLDMDTANGVGDVDDGLMFLQALHSPELNIRGVSVVFGNTDLDKAEHVAKQIIDRFGRSAPPGSPPDAPALTVHRGAASAADLGAETDAVRAMAESLRERPMTIAAVGPVTNVGSLLRLHPDLAPRITQVIVVAGRRPGQKFLLDEFKDRSKAAPPDFNFELDPEAMGVIFASKVRLVMAPWEVSSSVWISRGDLARLSARSDSGAWIDRTSQYWLDRWEKGLGVAAFNPYDTLAIGWLTHPHLVHGFEARATIEQGPDDGATTGTSSGRGTKPYLHARPVSGDGGDGDANALYLFAADRAFKPVLLDTLAGVSAGPTDTRAQTARDRTLGGPVFNHDAFDRAVHRFVNPDGLVDYAALRHEPADLDAYIDALAGANLDALPRDERLALLINAYNAFTLKLITERSPISSIKDIPEAERWKAVRWRLGGRSVSLDMIEHEMIRPVFKEPRVHFALVCAGFDCPPLRAEAYTGRWLDAQLDDQARRFHAGAKWLRFDAQTGVLSLSSIYKWYGRDFGPNDADVVRHAARYSGPLKTYLRAGHPADSVKIEWLTYDWRLNAR